MAETAQNPACLQEKEIEETKRSLQGQVRVISGIGDFTNVVTVHPDGLDLHCKFQLTESYPNSPPTISIRSTILDADQTAELTGFLQNEAASRLGQVMLVDLMAACKKWLLDNNVDVTAKAIAEKSKNKKRQGKPKVIKQKGDCSNEEISQKKPAMRTAADVIKRLQWDKAINMEDFIVGYMDRIVGLVEKKFTAFTWEDLASVDIYSLAIPQHRIQYFKYKTEKVWDKNERLDNVFGSTGGKYTLVEAVQKYDSKHKTECTDRNDELNVENQLDELNLDGSKNESNEYVESDVSELEDTDAATEKMAAKGNTKPNYFVSLRITDPKTVEKLIKAQQEIIQKYPKYAEHKIAANGFHLTLAVLKLDSDDDKRVCVEEMNRAKPTFEHLAKQAEPLMLEGLDHFGPSVIFAKVKYSREFLDLVDYIRSVITNLNVQVETHSFKAHLTLFKVKKSTVRNWDESSPVLNSDGDVIFGSQAVDNIQVCEMRTLPKFEGSSEFYHSIFHMDIDP